MGCHECSGTGLPACFRGFVLALLPRASIAGMSAVVSAISLQSRKTGMSEESALRLSRLIHASNGSSSPGIVDQADRHLFLLLNLASEEIGDGGEVRRRCRACRASRPRRGRRGRAADGRRRGRGRGADESAADWSWRSPPRHFSGPLSWESLSAASACSIGRRRTRRRR